MFIIMMVATLISSVCTGIAFQQGKLTKPMEEGGLNAQVALTVGISVALALFLGASFMIEMYEYTDLDFWDYGNITSQGVIYMSAKILGAIGVVENLVALVVLAIKDLKEKDSNT